MFGVRKVAGTLTAKSPVYHGGNEKSGSVCLLNTIKFIVDGRIEEVPIISGNAIRGYLRRLIMADLLNQVGYAINVSTKGGLMLYHSLFTGGVLETVSAKDSGVIDLELKSRMISLIPPVRLFGLCYGNQMVEGKLKVGMAYPVCRELRPVLPESFDPQCSYHDLITYIHQTRRDDLKAEREEGEQAVQMLVEYQVFAPGTTFYHEFKVEDPDEVDISCLARCIELWRMKPFIGGKSSAGFGELNISYDLSETSERYLEFLKNNREAIVSLLRELEMRGSKAKAKKG